MPKPATVPIGMPPHTWVRNLRFGTVSVRQAVKEALAHSETFLNELIWREFFAHILFHFPGVADTELPQRVQPVPLAEPTR
jgi:deoxyribodipyrimidine photolyase